MGLWNRQIIEERACEIGEIGRGKCGAVGPYTSGIFWGISLPDVRALLALTHSHWNPGWVQRAGVLAWLERARI